MDWVQSEGCVKELNGRQIRNIVFTAMGLAHAETESAAAAAAAQSKSRGGGGGGSRQRGGAGQRVLLNKVHLADVTRNSENFAKAVIRVEAAYKSNQLRGGGS